jgi:hypothetical protein
MKRVFLILAFLLIGISFVSAYGEFSLSNFLDSIDPSTLVLGTLFLIFFAVINFSLGRFFKNSKGEPNKPVTTIVSLGVSVLAIYGIHRSGWDYESLFSNFFSGVGISTEALYPILMLVVFGLAIFLMFKFGIGATFLSFGILFLGLALIGAVYQKTLLGIIGGVLILIGAFLLYRRTRKTYYIGRGR